MRSIFNNSVIRHMSKSKKNQKNTANVGKTEVELASPVQINKDGNLVIHILAKPGAKSNTITDISPGGVGVQIAGKPVDGEANAELLKYISGVLGVKKNEVSLDKGSKSRQKTILINKEECTVDFVIAKLQGEIGK